MDTQLITEPVQHVNGRRAILQMLDRLLAEDKNIRRYAAVFQEQIDQDPMAFFRGIVMPLMKKETMADDTEKFETIQIELITAQASKRTETEEGTGAKKTDPNV